MRVAVIGGGLAGLVVALRRCEAGDDVILLEAEARLGGQISTERTDGFVVEHGAEGFIARSQALSKLAHSLGLEQELVDQLTPLSYIFDGRELVPLEPGEAAKKLGFQVPSEALGRGIRSFRLGMGQLIEALGSEVHRRGTVHLDARVERLEARHEEYELGFAGDKAARFDQVVLATSSRAAGALLEPLLGESAALLRVSKTLSSVTVSLAYPRIAIDHALDASGFVVGESQQTEGFRACAFVSSKLPNRAPPDQALIRIFFRPEPANLEHDSDAIWIARAERCAARALHLTARAESAWVSRWANALPVFDRERTEAVRVVEAALGSRGVHLAGAAFHGSGIDAAAQSAEHTANALTRPRGRH